MTDQPLEIGVARRRRFILFNPPSYTLDNAFDFRFEEGSASVGNSVGFADCLNVRIFHRLRRAKILPASSSVFGFADGLCNDVPASQDLRERLAFSFKTTPPLISPISSRVRRATASAAASNTASAE
jgi:hypothetical protein